MLATGISCIQSVQSYNGNTSSAKPASCCFRMMRADAVRVGESSGPHLRAQSPCAQGVGVQRRRVIRKRWRDEGSPWTRRSSGCAGGWNPSQDAGCALHRFAQDRRMPLWGDGLRVLRAADQGGGSEETRTMREMAHRRLFFRPGKADKSGIQGSDAEQPGRETWKRSV